MLEVYEVLKCNVVNLRMVGVLITGRNQPSTNNPGTRVFRFSHLNSVSVHIKCTSNMAAYYDYDVNDVTTPHVYSSIALFYDVDVTSCAFVYSVYQ